jgi:hypothetical protein
VTSETICESNEARKRKPERQSKDLQEYLRKVSHIYRMGASQERAGFFNATLLVVMRHRECIRNTGGPPGRRKIHPVLPLRDYYIHVHKIFFSYVKHYLVMKNIINLVMKINV